MFLLNATKSCLTLVAGEMLVAGSVNVHEVKFEFSDDWSDLVKTVTFRTVSDSRSVILNDEGECIIPWEVLKDSSPYLYVGLIGTRDAEVVLPTIWADLGEVRNGTEPGADVTDPTPTVYEQVLSELGSRANNLNVKDEKLQLRSGETILSEVELPKQESSDPGITDHNELLNRDLPDQHPISAITGLEEALKEAAESGADSWDDIGTKQAFEPIELAGDITGAESIELEGMMFYKVAEPTAPVEAYEGANVQCPTSPAPWPPLTAIPGLLYEWGALLRSYYELVFGEGSENEIHQIYILAVTAENEMGIPIGIYCSGNHENNNINTTFAFPVIISKEVAVPIPTEYLPTTVPVIQTAQIGQTIVVKAVDENGKPTEWEAAEMPEHTQADWNQYDESQPDYVKNRPFYEVPTVYEITWDGDMTDRTALDLSVLGVDGAYLVKVSDRVYTKEELVGMRFADNSGSAFDLINIGAFIDVMPGAFAQKDYSFAVVYSADEVNAGLGLPASYFTNGTYFLCAPSAGVYVSALIAPYRLAKMDEKYLPESVLKKNTVPVICSCSTDTVWARNDVDFSQEGLQEIQYTIGGNLLDVEIRIDTDESVTNQRLTFAMSYGRGSEFTGTALCCTDEKLYQVFLRVIPSKGVIYVAAKTVDI